MTFREVEAVPLSRLSFAPFGDVIETADARNFAINAGTTERFHDLAAVDTAARDGHTLVNIFRGEPFEPPIEIAMFERHPLGSQLFMPLHRRPWLVVVAEADAHGAPGVSHAFLAHGDQGVNYARGVWHHPLLALEERSDFLVIDRGGSGGNLEEHGLDEPFRVSLPA